MTKIIRAPFFSPQGLLLRAAALVLFYATCHLVGLREYTTFFSGTPASTSIGFTLSAALGLLYTLAYLGFVLLAPILAIAALLLKIIARVFPISDPEQN